MSGAVRSMLSMVAYLSVCLFKTLKMSRLKTACLLLGNTACHTHLWATWSRVLTSRLVGCDPISALEVRQSHLANVVL